MTLPKQLILEEVENCPILIQKPADEVMKEIGIVELNSGKWSGEIMIGAFLINMENDRGRINFTNGMENILIGIDYTKGEISVDRSGCSKPEWGNEFGEVRKAKFTRLDDRQLLVVVDTTSIEIFAAGGEICGTFLYFVERPFSEIEVGGI